MDEFSPPVTPSKPGSIASTYVVVPPAIWSRLDPVRRDAMARLTRRPLEQLDTQAQFGQPIVALRTVDPLAATDATALLDDLLDVPAETVGPLDVASLLVFGGLGIGWTLFFGASAQEELCRADPRSVLVASLGPLTIAWATWTYAIAPTQLRAAAEIACLAPPQPLPTDAPALADSLAGDRTFEALGVLGALILAEARGSPTRTAALRRAAALRAPDPRRANRLERRADVEAGVTPIRMSSEAVPWRHEGLLLIPVREDVNEWPQTCPLCNEHGTTRVRVYINAGTESTPGLSLLAYAFLGFPFGLVAVWLSRRGVNLPTDIWLCDTHLAVRTRSAIGAFFAVALLAVGIGIGLQVSRWGILAGSVGCAFVLAATRFSPFKAQLDGEGCARVWGAHPDFVRDRPLVP